MTDPDAGRPLTVVPALVLSARGTADSVLYHVQRGVQIESLWANLIGIAHLQFWVRPTFRTDDEDLRAIASVHAGNRRARCRASG